MKDLPKTKCKVCYIMTTYEYCTMCDFELGSGKTEEELKAVIAERKQQIAKFNP